MNNKKLIRLNGFVNKAYECFSFAEFLKLAIVNLHHFVAYDSGMFYCGISKDCSFFKPYLGGNIDEYYQKQQFEQRDAYLEQGQSDYLGEEAYVYKSSDYRQGVVVVESEPRSAFLEAQDRFRIACVRIVHEGRFLGEIYLHRSKDKPDFDEEDLFVLRLMQPHISTVFNIIHKLTAVKYIESSDISDSTLGLCVFDLDMSLIGGNLTGIEMLKVSTIFSSSILYHLKEICIDMLDNNQKKGMKCVSCDSKILKTKNGDIEIKMYIDDEHRAGREQKVIVMMQYTDKNALLDEYKFKFTKRQADIIDGLIQGKNNSQLAENFHISENTVKTHIQNIYKKTGTNSRTELAYVLMLNKS